MYPRNDIFYLNTVALKMPLPLVNDGTFRMLLFTVYVSNKFNFYCRSLFFLYTRIRMAKSYDHIGTIYSHESPLYLIDVFVTRLIVSFVDKEQNSYFDANFNDTNLLATFKLITTCKHFSVDPHFTSEVLNMTHLNERFDRLIRLIRLAILSSHKTNVLLYNLLYEWSGFRGIATEIEKVNHYRYHYTEEMTLELYIGALIYKEDKQYENVGFTHTKPDSYVQFERLFVLIEKDKNMPVYMIEVESYDGTHKEKVDMCRLWPVVFKRGLFSQPLYLSHGYSAVSKRLTREMDHKTSVLINARITYKRRARINHFHNVVLDNLALYICILRNQVMKEESERRRLYKEMLNNKASKLMAAFKI